MKHPRLIQLSNQQEHISNHKDYWDHNKARPKEAVRTARSSPEKDE